VYAVQSVWPQDKIKQTIMSLKKAWYLMTEQKEIPYDYLRPVVADSWLRCLDANVHYTRRTAPLKWQEEFVHLNSNSFIEITAPVFSQLYDWISESGFLIALANAEGILLQTAGKEDMLAPARHNQFIPGADWSEQAAGTNGIGTCLVLNQPVQIFSFEHYCQGWQNWTCSGAPIHDPLTGKILGVINISGYQENVHAHNLSLVTASAKMIEQKLMEWQFQFNRKAYNLVLDRDSDGFIVVNPQGHILSVNPSARELLSSSYFLHRNLPSKLVQMPELYEKWEKRMMGSEVIDEEVMVFSTGGRQRLGVSCIPIVYDRIETGTLIVLRRINRTESLPKSERTIEETPAKPSVDLPIITASEKMQKVLHFASLAARNEANILLLGESGTGKEVLARFIHDTSTRRQRPFVAVNCGAIAKELIASELFGYTEGAFTGASKRGKKGKFEQAAGGTLFLDEIGEMPLDMQVSLLRVLEGRKVCPVGGEEEIPVTCRIMAATHRDLYNEVEKGRFRADLYYRLNVLTLDIPPLRERNGDVLLLVEHFLKGFTRKLLDMDIELIRFFQHYSWPGNVRQLKNIVERLAYLSEGKKMTKDMLPAELLRHMEQRPTLCGQNEGEKRLIQEVLKETASCYAEAARRLGISRSTLYRKMKKYRIKP